jgi:hypothetical protein
MMIVLLKEGHEIVDTCCLACKKCSRNDPSSSFHFQAQSQIPEKHFTVIVT